MLPAYVERNHDARLRETLRRATESRTPALILVRGDSCTGKTRAAFEALAAGPALESWNPIFPRTSASLLEALAAGALAAHTALRFDDAHKILAGRTGEAVAASLLSRLAEPGPLRCGGHHLDELFHRAHQTIR
ncbi:hypothetical protein [Streptomyces sp. NPDC014006]|uniref:hypothetical protein n=1 Tax=Streptomyces sp. NPDC014006 TaxID=3364870 RepID=UPI0037004900